MFFKTITPLLPTIKDLIKVLVIIYPLIWIMVFVTIITNTEVFKMQTKLNVDFLLFEKDLLISSLIHPVLWILFLNYIFKNGIMRAIVFSLMIMFFEHILFFAFQDIITGILELEIPFKMHFLINLTLLLLIIHKLRVRRL